MKLLRQELAKLEGSGRYPGGPYPDGLVPFPSVLTGQGFFPGGDGLWRDDDAKAIRLASPHLFPTGGIMFLGNDFGTLASFKKLRGFENPPTWRYLKQRLNYAQIPGSVGFYTNAYLGLRNDRDALARPTNHPTYREFCAEFLLTQIEHQSPRLIVTFGSRPAELLSTVLRPPSLVPAAIRKVTCSGRELTVLFASAPFSDLFKGTAARAAEGALLAQAWEAAKKL